MKLISSKITQRSLFCLLCLSVIFCQHVEMLAQTNISNVSILAEQKSRTVLEVTSDGDTIIRYVYDPFDFGEIYNENSIQNSRVRIHNRGLSPKARSASVSTESVHVESVPQSIIGKSVGQIPYSQGVTPTGGKTITIPIQTAKVPSSTPTITLNYNSQIGNTVAGYGWSISGVSSITLANKNLYYDNEIKVSQLSNPGECVFALDGIRIVCVGEDSYETAQGFIIVKKVMKGNHIAYFEALYPNGNKATFGFIDNTTTQISYPITSMIDIRGYRIDYNYEQRGNVYYITNIKYGSKTTSHPGEIVFEYADRDDVVSVYAHGEELSSNRLLKKVVSNFDSQELRTYKLIHSQTGSFNQLKKIECSVGLNSLNPLQFSYGNDISEEEEQLSDNFYGIMSQYFSGNSTTQIQYIRGKFKQGNYSDGMIALPLFPIYRLTATFREWRTWRYVYSYQYGSAYSPEQDILIVPSIGCLNTPISIKAESGFQTINALDVNGDGIDEIVKVNFDGATSSKTNIKITVYSLNSDLSALTSKVYNVELEGIVNSNDYFYSPMSRSYYFGNFKGDGKAQLLTVSHDESFIEGDKRTSYFAIIDLSTGQLISEENTFQHSITEGKNILTFDIDGDGRTELCHASDSGLDIYNLKYSSLKYNGTKNEINATTLNKNLMFADINGDGKLDILVAPPYSHYNFNREELPIWAPKLCPICNGEDPIHSYNQINCSHCGENLKDLCVVNPEYRKCRVCNNDLEVCTQMGTIGTSREHSITCSEHGNTFIYSRMLNYEDNGSSWTCYLNTGTGYCLSNMEMGNLNSADKVIFADVNRDGLSDMVRVRNGELRIFLNEYGTINLSESAPCCPILADSFEFIPANIIDFYKSSHLVYVSNHEIHTIDFNQDKSKSNLLTSMIDSYGLTNSYVYGDMTDGDCYHLSSTCRLYPYAQAIFPMSLLTKEFTTLPDNGNLLSDISYEYNGAVVHQAGLGFIGFEKTITTDNLQASTSEEIRNPELHGLTTKVVTATKETEIAWSENRDYYKKTVNPRMYSTKEKNKLTNTTVTTSYKYDSYNNPTQITQNYGTDLKVVTDQTYFNGIVSDRLVAGQPLTKTVTRTRGADKWIDKEVMVYNSVTRLPTSKTIYTGANGTNKVSETRWTYDINGNVLSEKSATYDGTEFLGNSYTYDTSGRNILTMTNSMGQTTSFSNFNKYGNPCTVIDHKNRISTKTYDAWGALKTTTQADGSKETVTSAWGGKGKYTVTKTRTGAPATVVHYDATGREVRTGNQRFNGRWQYIDKVYDSKGRLEKVSLPFRGTSAEHWNTYGYDLYGRPTQVTEASGKITTWSYNGASVTETREGVAVTTTVDASGSRVSSTDPGGTIEYTLRADGQTSGIKLFGTITTSFNYDDYGRKITINDPSAGTQTYTYSCCSDGTSTNTVTDANGKTITTLADKYGRTTSVIRPEFSTTYTYDSDGRLSEESSTNATSKTITYDDYDRPLTLTEKVPDGKYLKKSYVYNVSGNVGSITYSTQDGEIATENYIYANGHNTEIKLNNTTSIWKLTSENDLGLPTATQTGSLSRTYSYDTYGMPTGRKVGNLQDYSYEFDVMTGNLTSRTDNTRNLTETFSYDSLNRLSGIGSATIQYYETGSIAYMPGVGSMEYTSSIRPYKLTGLQPENEEWLLNNDITAQEVKYTSFQRPESIEESGTVATFTYGANGERVKMQTTFIMFSPKTRYYIGGVYEYDSRPQMERLYLAGDAYTAPAVYVKQNGKWTLYQICRDYLGSITHIVKPDGSLLAEYSYDAWGRMRDPETHEIYDKNVIPSLFLGRGYTGHEHLPQFGLINMNARLYDPAVGRFLSPDPYVQTTDRTQNYNRYSYCLNNPLRYTDESGEIVTTAVIIGGAILGAYFGGVYANPKKGDPTKREFNPLNWDYKSAKTWRYMFYGGIVGATSAWAGVSIAASGIPFANTASVMASSFINSYGTHIYTDGSTSISISAGAVSYDFNHNSWGYLGKKGNSSLENCGYVIGTTAITSDLIAMASGNAETIVVNAESLNNQENIKEGWYSHSSVTNHNGDRLISVGPIGTFNKSDRLSEFISNSQLPADIEYSTYWGDNGTWSVPLYNVSTKVLQWYVDPVRKWDILFNSCVGHVSKGLFLSGIPTIYSFHPYLLNLQLMMRQVGLLGMSNFYESSKFIKK